MKVNHPFFFPIMTAALALTGCQLESQPSAGVTLISTLSAPSQTAQPATTSASSGAASPTAGPEYPLDISVMRLKAYPGSDITVLSTLPPRASYNRYIVSYDSDGLPLHALLTVPTGDKPAGGWPVILLNHGYIPPPEYSTEQSYERVVDIMASSGYIVFKPDYRGNGDSPGTPSQIYISPDYVTDSLNALASIRRYPDANPDKVGVWGHSMGGNITLHDLVISHDIKAAVLMAGVVGSYADILDWWNARVASGVLTTQNDQQTEQLVQRFVQLHGTPQSNPGFWNPMDPTQFVSDIQPPVLIQVGSADTVVPPDFSQQLAGRMQQAAKNVQFHLYPGADHNLSPDTVAAVQEAMAFFDQHLR